jgi:MFS family permease
VAARSIGPTRLGSSAEVEVDPDVIDLRDGVKTRRRGESQDEDAERPAQLRESRFLGSPAFRRLWISQVFSALGDWIGFIAITAIANHIWGPSAALGAVSVVLSARLIPGFFLSPVAGVLIDRYDRKHVMVWCDFGRALVLCCIPFARNLPELFIASLLLELMTMLWSPAKEASVPKLVKPEFLSNANSLSLAAAYGTFPFASAVFTVLAKVPDWLGASHFFAVHLTKEAVALYFDALTYLISAAVIATLAIHHDRKKVERRFNESRTSAGLQEAKEGWRYVARTPRVRAVILGLGTGLVGGGMIVPLGPTFANKVLSAGSGGYGLLLTAMGTGVGIGVVGLGVLQKRLPIDKTFTVSIFGAGIMLIIAATMHGLGAAVACIGGLGVFAGAVYVLGFTNVQLNTDDEMRGRVFATLYTLTRACILLAFFLAPLLSLALDKLARMIFGTPARIPGIHLYLTGVRITLWLAGAIIISAGFMALASLRRPSPSERPS